MAEVTRDQSFKLRLSATEMQRFEAVASHYEMSVAAVIRLLMRREADVLFRPALSFADAMQRDDVRRVLVAQTERSKHLPEEYQQPAESKRVSAKKTKKRR